MSFRFKQIDNIGKTPPPKGVVIFIHGLGGGRETWNKMSNFLDTQWNANCQVRLLYHHTYSDTAFWSKIGIFFSFIPYVGPLVLFLLRICNGESIENLANGLHSYIESNCRKEDRIILVGHSMGGLVLRKLVVNRLQRSHSVENIVKVITYATPYGGSKYAWFGVTIQIRQMHYYKSSFLEKLNEQWNNLSASKKVNPSYIVATRDKIVSQSSASSDDADPHIVWVNGRGHKSIIKPVRADDTAFKTLFNALKDELCNYEISDESGLEDYTLPDDNEEVMFLPDN
jgi:pimeloyl-ACP methyl ester carboxylesterase